MRLECEVRWEHMFPHELEAAFAACPAVYFAYGLCEPHGPQNTLGLDALKAHGILVKRHRHMAALWRRPTIGTCTKWPVTPRGRAKMSAR
jgi:hypothetical protein